MGRRRTSRKNFAKIKGTRAEVFHGTAHHTSGGLKKRDLKKNKKGSIVSVKMSEKAKKAYRKNSVLKAKSREMKEKNSISLLGSWLFNTNVSVEYILFY